MAVVLNTLSSINIEIIISIIIIIFIIIIIIIINGPSTQKTRDRVPN